MAPSGLRNLATFHPMLIKKPKQKSVARIIGLILIILLVTSSAKYGENRGYKALKQCTIRTAIL